MRAYKEILKKFCGKCDVLAGLFFFAVMVLVVLNIILRTVFKHPITGAYELVGLLTAVGISLALANCLLNNGHVAVGFFIDRLPVKKQVMVDLVINTVSLIFWSLITWQLFIYGGVILSKGVVSSTALIPLYPFIFLIGIGLLSMSMVICLALLELLDNALSGLSLAGRDIEEIARKAS
ncbi:MAG: TRAP transporter small permease [Syntrophomonadaceae bacterium]|jgi:TRAP-type C4-dicarboxylate transport system permease small subunit